MNVLNKCTVNNYKCYGIIENAHLKSKATGGKDTFPLCTKHHNEIHNIGIVTFQRKYNIDKQLFIDAGVPEWKFR